ncbi:unnamed protein product, partial [Staurois parvus]
GRPAIVNAGSRETRYSESGGRLDIVSPGRADIVSPGRADIVSPGRLDIVNAGSGETRYSECRVRGDQI